MRVMLFMGAASLGYFAVALAQIWVSIFKLSCWLG